MAEGLPARTKLAFGIGSGAAALANFCVGDYALIGDSTHQIARWGMPGVRIRTDAGLEGWGYTGTHAVLMTDRLVTSAIADVMAPLLIGTDATEVRHLHTTMTGHPNNIWMGRGGVLQMAISAINIALWDLKAKAAEQPLWQLLGRSEDATVEAYGRNCRNARQ